MKGGATPFIAKIELSGRAWMGEKKKRRERTENEREKGRKEESTKNRKGDDDNGILCAPSFLPLLLSFIYLCSFPSRCPSSACFSYC